MSHQSSLYCFFFFNDTATTEIYTLSLHDALPIWLISPISTAIVRASSSATPGIVSSSTARGSAWARSEEHTSELQSRLHLVCRLLLEKKKKITDELYDSNSRTPTVLA